MGKLQTFHRCCKPFSKSFCSKSQTLKLKLYYSLWLSVYISPRQTLIVFFCYFNNVYICVNFIFNPFDLRIAGLVEDGYWKRVKSYKNFGSRSYVSLCFPRFYLQNVESALYYKGVVSKLELDSFLPNANQAQNFQYNYFHWYQSDNKRYSPKVSFNIQRVEKNVRYLWRRRLV